MREQWGLEEEVLDGLGSGGAAGLNSKYIISQELEGIGRLNCGLRAVHAWTRVTEIMRWE